MTLAVSTRRSASDSILTIEFHISISPNIPILSIRSCARMLRADMP
jgi:hypothetical protein